MIKKEFKISIFKIIKFIAIFLVIDLILGSIAQELFFSQETGKFARTTHAIRETNAKVLIFGSSHAHRHYVPEVVEKELNTTCYNVGAEGQQLLYHTALLKMILKRTKPELIVLNIDESFLYKSDVAYERLSDLHPYYENNRDELKPILSLKSRLTDFKLFFKSYQVNSTIVHAIRYYLSPQIDDKGYRPLYGVLKPETKENQEKEYIEVIDKDFVAALQTFIETAKNNKIKLVFVTSPTFSVVDHTTNESYQKIVQLANDQKIPIFDYFNNMTFRGKAELFHDFSHLNHKGAQLFTKSLTDSIIEIRKAR